VRSKSVLTAGRARSEKGGVELVLSPEERELLCSILEIALSDLRVEVRRTDATDFQDRLKVQEHRLEGLLQRLLPA
jgi:hypothetical protein